MRDVVLANHDLDVNTEVIFVSKHLNYFAARVLRPGRPLNDLDVYDHTFKVGKSAAASLFADHPMTTWQRQSMLRLYLWHFPAARDRHGIGELLIDWLNIVVAIAVMEDSNYSRVSAS